MTEMMRIKRIVKQHALRLFPEKMLQLLKKAHYARNLRSASEDEEVDFKVIRQFVRPGDHVVDIGANIGFYTKYLSELVGEHGALYSIEPVPLTFDILCFNVRKFQLKNVKLINCAISDTEGSVMMEVPLYDSGGENFYQARIVEKKNINSLRRVVVNSKTIDSLFSGLPFPISFIKCDVEVHELKCIKGAMNSIRKSKPAWLIEISGTRDRVESNAYEIFTLLREEGYEPFTFHGGKLRSCWLGNWGVNCFFLAQKHLEVLKRQGFASPHVD